MPLDQRQYAHAMELDTATDKPMPKVAAQLTGSNVLQGKLKNVVTAGTRVRLDDIPCREVTVIARKGNTGSIYVGGADVSSSVFGVELAAKDSFTFIVNNANLIYIDASVSGEGVSYVAV
ncbi:hypothetical protein [Neobacillus niacini]|uniref:hypothetical protein n=1 Tax=Neobacillus niacini TaxID=86668 RepID=UPI0021CB8114|nr:hypothetical protein [Neobacillus niacini]MCM3763436.1 hypothetical protein [Neobacillus niacini]